MSGGAKSQMMRNYRFQKVIAGVGAFLMIIKFVAYFITGSVSILTDALESIVNVIAGLIGLYALYRTMQPPDRDHPYGHGKIELISSSVEGTMICAAGIVIITETLLRVAEGNYEIRSLDLGLVIVAFAAAVNFAMGATAVRMGRRSHSIALEASGKHLCSDTYSSAGILLGLATVYICDMFGVDAVWIDPAMAMLFGAVIVITGVRVVQRSFSGIMDRSDRKLLTAVTRCLNHARTDDVLDIHHLRVTRYGAALHIDAHMVVRQVLTVRDAEKIVLKFRSEVTAMLGGDLDITFMAEPCERRFCRYCRNGCSERRFDFVEINVISLDKATRESPKRSRLYRDDA